MIGTQGPTGSTGYRADPNQPGGYTQYTNLSPQEQQTYDLSKQAENGALGVANNQLGRIDKALGQGLDLSQLPGLQTGGIQSSFDKGGALQYGFDPGQAIQGQVGGDLNAARQQAQDAVYSQATSRLDPRFDQSEAKMRSRLANQGLEEGSDAYKTAADNFGRERTDAYNQAQYSSIQAGEDAANALYGRQLSQGQFANQAAGQQYSQNQGSAAFNNQTAGQDFSQNASAAQFNNQAQDQGFNQSLAARQNSLQEQAYVQNQPINQFSALMGLGQVGTPQGVGYTPSQVGQTDVIGANALKVQADQAAAQRAASQKSGLMGGLFSLGSAAIMASDRRLKTDIRRVGTRTDGLGLYRFRYRAGGGEHVGVMADEVRKVRPDLVVRRPDGFDAVNYAGLGF